MKKNTYECYNVLNFDVELDKELTNGHTYCNLIVNFKTKRITACLFGGESYTFILDGSDFLKNAIYYLKNRHEWIYRNTSNQKLLDNLDMFKTSENIMNIMVEKSDLPLSDFLYDNTLDNDNEFSPYIDADIPFFDELEDFIYSSLTNSVENVTSSYILSEWDSLFDNFIKVDLLPSASELYDYYDHNSIFCEEGDIDCRIFSEKVCPILGDILEKHFI